LYDNLRPEPARNLAATEALALLVAGTASPHGPEQNAPPDSAWNTQREGTFAYQQLL
jgi:hypothetical protein